MKFLVFRMELRRLFPTFRPLSRGKLLLFTSETACRIAAPEAPSISFRQLTKRQKNSKMRFYVEFLIIDNSLLYGLKMGKYNLKKRNVFVIEC